MSGNDRASGKAHVTMDARVRAWLEVRDPLERQLSPLGQAAIDRLDLRSGERVLDIGCGIGATPRQLAQAVGRDGHILAIDMLPAAIQVQEGDADLPAHVRFIQGDAQTISLPLASFDAAFSRFAVMFFSDPVAAFMNIRSALRPGGRLSFVCWRKLAENELDNLPLDAASAHLPADLVSAAAMAEHFSFADPDFLRETLVRSGYTDIDIRPHDAKVEAGSLPATIDLCVRFGSLGKILRDHPQHREKATAAVEDMLMSRNGPNGPSLQAVTWIVHALARG